MSLSTKMLEPWAHDLAPLKPNEYRCAACRGVFEKGLSDEEAAAELDTTFAVPTSECDLVCDDCYKKMGFA